jgi:proteasome lid subunit RPN8/RPN11
MGSRALVFLDQGTFIALVTAAAEAYRRECYGVLLGTRNRGRAYIRVAMAYQSARRAPQSVRLVGKRRRIIRRVLQAFPRYDYIGEFHSHPGTVGNPVSACPSREDLQGVRPGECEIIIAVRDSPARRPWRHCADGSLSGTAGRFYLKIRAYRAEAFSGRRVRGRVAGIRCSYAVTTASSPRLLEKQKRAPGP